MRSLQEWIERTRLIMTIGRFGLRRRDYDFPPFRPPSEANSLLLRVTRGCPWNRCTFCSMYKGMKFERRELDEVLEDISMAREYYSDQVRTVFIGDSNSLVLKAEDLVKILNSLYASFPHVERVTSYARAKTIAKKEIEDLKKIYEAGLNRLHVGLETGDRELLKEIDKGATPEEMVEAGRKAKEAGFEYSLYVLLGIGGEEKWEQHARGTADVLNQINPHFIRVRTFIPQPNSAIYEAMEEGRFQPASPETILKETRLLLKELEVASQFLSDHISNLVPLHGKLPEEKEEMIRVMDEVLKGFQDDASLREEMEARRHLTNL
ncbi:MAG: radical SAM protein [Deltaproteobacteria bacterium]|nr:radical SAM protein [Deltaproteobacteria bacterium]MBM4322455.1 radical SAM protein [Deltaproteobacteria bacterium]MBM4347089.1 radical SAM protein [Deltaproteobacteria bacterium]